jgi:hypothetical protein
MTGGASCIASVSRLLGSVLGCKALWLLEAPPVLAVILVLRTPVFSEIRPRHWGALADSLHGTTARQWLPRCSVHHCYPSPPQLRLFVRPCCDPSDPMGLCGHHFRLLSTSSSKDSEGRAPRRKPATFRPVPKPDMMTNPQECIIALL